MTTTPGVPMAYMAKMDHRHPINPASVELIAVAREKASTALNARCTAKCVNRA